MKQVVEYNTYRVRAYSHSAADDRMKMAYSEPIVAPNADAALDGAKKRIHKAGNGAGTEYKYRVTRVNNKIVLVVIDG